MIDFIHFCCCCLATDKNQWNTLGKIQYFINVDQNRQLASEPVYILHHNLMGFTSFYQTALPQIFY